MIYSSAGFGGGSSYLAVMALMNLPFQTYPTLALLCNLIVVTGSVIRFIKNKMINWKKTVPWIILSIPLSYVGGLIKMPEKLFISILALLLFITGIRIILNNLKTRLFKPSSILKAFIGGILGLISGMVGIGGGIFLSPLMAYWKMDKAKNIAITTTIFIFVNSFAGLIGKLSQTINILSLSNYWPILLSIFIGGQIGNHWCVYKATEKQLTILTGSLSLLASFTLLTKLF
jgi:uncharacterized membrane protein YfcA